MEIPTLAKRSACDRCRSKRVRCPRAGSSTASCSRCINAGAPCITGFPGNPGRPRKARRVEATTLQASAVIDVDTSLPESWPATYSIPPPVEADHHLSTTEEESPYLLVTDPTAWFEVGPGSEGMLLNLVDDNLGRAPFKPLNNEQDSSPETTSNLWTGLNVPLADGNLAGSMTASTLLEDLQCPPEQQQASLDTPDNLSLLHTGALECPDELTMYSGLNPPLDTNMGLSHHHHHHHQPTLGNRLVGFREKMDQHVTVMDAFFSNPQKLVDEFEKEPSTEPAGPVAVLLKGIKGFTDILQSLTVAATRLSGAPPPDSSSLSLKSETMLLVLSCHLALLRLCNSLFRGATQYFICMPSERLRSTKVKAVLRVGGLSLLQDMPAKTYALSVVDIIQNQIHQLETILGIPAAYSLLGGNKEEGEGREANRSQVLPSTLGIFKGEHRTKLLHSVMEQEDVSSCVRSIRDNLKTTLAFLVNI